MNDLLNALIVITDSTPSNNAAELIETIVTTMLEHNVDTIDRKALLTVKMAGYQPENVDYHDNEEWTIDGNDYRVLTDDEANDACHYYIKESVWTFNADFLAKHTDIDPAVFTLLQEQCESANDAILTMIKDFDGFVEDAIDTDGRGNYLSPYDGEETELGEFYLYRTN